MPDNSQSQTTVLIASSLKPVKDIRAWGKLGISIRETSKYSLNIIGFSAKKIEKSEEVNFYSSMAFSRSRWDRIRAMARFTELLLKIRPELLICCTYEYLPIARFFKKILGYKIVYDVQENYAANLALNPLLTEKKRKQLGKIIRSMEAPNGIDLFLFAESCYQNEMPEKTPYLVLENKFTGRIQQISIFLGYQPVLLIEKFTPFIPAQACELLATFPWIFTAKLLKKEPQMNLQFFSN